MSNIIIYKKTGNDWYPEIPEHWDLKKIKYQTKFLNGYAFKADEYVTEDGIPIIRIGDVKNPIDLKGCIQVPQSYLDKTENWRVYKNDILIALTGATIGKSAIFDNDEIALLNQRVGIVRPKEGIQNSFLKFIINSDTFRKYIYLECDGGAQENIGKEEIGNYFIPIPSEDEQLAISNFLEVKTNEIDNIIAKKRELIDRLTEERNAIINQAVTKGLKTNSKLKPSDVYWLGDIPKHWLIKKLKYVSLVQPSNVDKKSNDKEIPVKLCNYVNVYKNEFITEDIEFMEATAKNEEIQKFKLKFGDVLITKDSETPNDIAVPALVKIENDDLVCGYHLAQIRANEGEVLGEYIFRIFQSKNFNSNFEIAANGVTRYGLSIDAIKSVLIPIPPIDEQKKIVEFILSETSKIDAIKKRITQEIELIKEYRTSLINEVVTGKITLN